MLLKNPVKKVFLNNMGELILSDFFNTKTQANEFSERLSVIEANIYEVNFNIEKELEEQLGSKKRDSFLALLRENNISATSNSELLKFFTAIHETIKNLPLLSITVAIDPKENVLKAISDWFVLNVKKQVLLEVTTDPEIIAGAVVEFGGKRFDASIKTVYNQICAENLGGQAQNK